MWRSILSLILLISVASSGLANERVYDILRTLREDLAIGERLLSAEVVDVFGQEFLTVEFLGANDRVDVLHYDIENNRQLDAEQWQALQTPDDFDDDWADEAEEDAASWPDDEWDDWDDWEDEDELDDFDDEDDESDDDVEFDEDDEDDD